MSDTEGYLPMGMVFSKAKKNQKYCPISQTKQCTKLPPNIQIYLEGVVRTYYIFHS